MTYILEQTPEGVDLVVTGGWTQDAEDSLTSGRADGLVLNYARGYQERDLAFLTGLPIRRLDILARTIKDLSPVYSLSDRLTALQVQSDPRAILDLDRLPLLEQLGATWEQIRRSIKYAPRLEHLFILSYTESDLDALSSLTDLVSVVMKDYPRVRTLDGVENLPWLVELGVHLGRYLEDISALTRLRSPLIETLQLPSCKKIVDLEPVSSCTSLRFFELSEGSEIPSAAPLADLQYLEGLYLYGSTKIADCDLRPIIELPNLQDFRIQNRRAYSPSVKEVQHVIKSRVSK